MAVSCNRERDPWFCLPVVFCMLADAGVSLVFQPGAYWQDTSRSISRDAGWGVLLTEGPGVFLSAFLVYCAVVAGIVVLVRGPAQKLFGMFIILAHSYGAASWCRAYPSDKLYWLHLLVLFLAEALVFAVYWRLSQRSRRPAP
jgi:hypothetical protein